jgi:N-acetylglucosaminyldiphosphoundecaprenol N-acetyl-beta-D-mannosaminyltransferase
MNNKVVLFEIGVSSLDKVETVNKILEFAQRGKRKVATYLNAHCINVSFIDREYKEIIKNVDLLYVGGMGVIWAARFLGRLLPERVNILDFFDLLVRGLREKRITIYLLGGTQNIAKKAEEVLRKKGLIILGSRGGFFDKIEEKEIIREIDILKPDILMVGMGVPQQEKWIQSNLRELNTNLCWAVGGVFDLLAGHLKRAPKWVINCGLEWLYLWLQDPRKLLGRYLLGNPLFVYRVLESKVKNTWREKLKRILR